MGTIGLWSSNREVGSGGVEWANGSAGGAVVGGFIHVRKVPDDSIKSVKVVFVDGTSVSGTLQDLTKLKGTKVKFSTVEGEEEYNKQDPNREETTYHVDVKGKAGIVDVIAETVDSDSDADSVAK